MYLSIVLKSMINTEHGLQEPRFQAVSSHIPSESQAIHLRPEKAIVNDTKCSHLGKAESIRPLFFWGGVVFFGGG